MVHNNEIYLLKKIIKKRNSDIVEKADKKLGITSVDVIKYVSTIAVIIPLLLGYFEYQRSVQQDKDNNFRVVVEKLSLNCRGESKH